jgi:hypothetical protein
MAGLRGSMSAFRSRFMPFLVAVCLCLPGGAPTAVAQRGGVRKPSPKKKADAKTPDAPQLPAYTPSPLQPLPLDQVPAIAPKVTFEGGQLSIVAHNCTLGDVLRAIKKQTGADIDIPPSATERVVADLGPGTPHEVIADLLNGTHFNYVIVGSATDPTAVESLALTPKSGGPETAAATPLSRPGLPQRVFQPGAVPPVQGGTPPADAAGQADTDDGSDPPEEASDQADGQDQTQPAAGDQQQGQQTPKTPEQLLQELQRQQQQLQQQQQQPGGQQQPGQPPPGGLFPNQPPTQVQPNKPD